MKKITIIFLSLTAISLFADDDNPVKILKGYETVITVTAKRLPDVEERLTKVPITITVITNDQIKESGAVSIQEVLQDKAGIIFYDQVGNGIQTTIGIRGFSDGRSAIVLLDGVRLNEAEDNRVDLDLIPLSEIERIEIIRGTSGALFGTGSIAGIISIVTKRGREIPKVDLESMAASFETLHDRFHTSGKIGDFDFLVSAGRRRSNGWRQNDGYSLDDALIKFGFAKGEKYDLGISLLYQNSTLSAPGALTEDEMRMDRTRTPFNLFDGSDGIHRLINAHYSFTRGRFRASFQAYKRDRTLNTLTTGRYGSGFMTRLTSETDGIIAEGRWTYPIAKFGGTLDFGMEYSKTEVMPRGYFTDIYGGNPYPATDNKTKANNLGIFVRNRLDGEKWSFAAAIRYDRDRVNYEDYIFPANSTGKSFPHATWNMGATYRYSDSVTLYSSIGEGRKIPTVLELFAYPGYFSNPDLKAIRSLDIEGGIRIAADKTNISASLFGMKTRDDVVFVLTDPVYFIGMNENVGASRRYGIEFEGRRELGFGFEAIGSLTYLHARITSGPYDGNKIPLVPGTSWSLGFGYHLNENLSMKLEEIGVSSRVIDNDLPNIRDSLPAYSIVNLSLIFQKPHYEIKTGMNNMLDRKYSTRGITNGYADYFTPAPPLYAYFSMTIKF